MAKAKFIEHNGTEHTVDVELGESLMKAALNNGVPGIDGDCGGECACGTCHVFIDEMWLAKLEPRHQRENEMLDFAAGSRPNSRLACQISMREDIDGITVLLPIGQH
ncbi:2Fe-2S ferredoxin [Cupriavidus sp. TA19]|uniref:2Fe-2S iron-sulfur cluster-binding protein n=1 Tax=unclassified Cupriavidus TaxID=2640874 RepID=UPI000E2E57E5|nr:MULTISPECIES: 2Fe-2S iron-sulfur cluster-binding protein [unclassified Cupriavidus]BDB30639.1 2Fe-2S iron-sulfur cluster binding domain-containing protein [Cupriavidus sp. P-10]GLC95721.1 2Fe-2S ferredoxin [Cupriavidus sp. TA19]